MRVTAEGPKESLEAIQREIEEACPGQISVEVVSRGEKSNLAGEASWFITVGLHYGADLVVALLAHYLYDLISKRRVSVKVNGSDIEYLDETEIADILKPSPPSNTESQPFEGDSSGESSATRK